MHFFLNYTNLTKIYHSNFITVGCCDMEAQDASKLLTKEAKFLESLIQSFKGFHKDGDAKWVKHYVNLQFIIILKYVMYIGFP